MSVYRILIKPRGGISSIPPSETLFGALSWGIRFLYGEKTLEELLDGFFTHPRTFTLSSSFPALQDEEGEWIYLYPRPRSKPEQGYRGIQYKEYRQAAYMDEDLFFSWINGMREKELFSALKQENSSLQEGVISRKIINLPISKTVSLPGTQLDRWNNSTAGSSTLFFSPVTFLSSHTCLHFLIKTDAMDFLRPVIQYAVERGFGGDRSVGRSIYDVLSCEKIKLPEGEGNVFISLSRFIPHPEELDFSDENTAYQILPVRSQVESTLEFSGENTWKRRVLYCVEGSTFAAQKKKEMYGRLPIVKELAGKRIRQYGISFPVHLRSDGHEV